MYKSSIGTHAETDETLIQGASAIQSWIDMSHLPDLDHVSSQGKEQDD